MYCQVKNKVMQPQARGDDMTFELFYYSFVAIVCFMAYFTFMDWGDDRRL